MDFFRPVSKEYPVTCLYGTPGSKYSWHIDEDSGIWIKGRKCYACHKLEPCGCLTPNFVGNHAGTDFSCPEGTPIYAAAQGMIVRVGWDSPVDDTNVGSMRILQLVSRVGYDSWWIVYRHLRTAIPKVGEHIIEGQRIGYSGRNGSQYICVELMDRDLQFKPIPIRYE